MPNPTSSNWFHPISDGTWHGKLLAKVFNWMYNDLLVPWFELNGYQVVAGKRNPKTGTVIKPVLVNAKTKKSVKSYDYFLSKGGKYYLGWGKFWPTFNSRYTKSYYKWTYKSNPFFFNFDPNKYQVKVGNKYYPINGKFLYWWDTADTAMYKKHNIDWIWSIRDCLYTMAKSGNRGYYSWVRNYKSLFSNYWNNIAWNSTNSRRTKVPITKRVSKTKRTTVAKAKPKPISRVKRTTVAKAKPKPISRVKRTTVAKAKPKPISRVKRTTVAKAKPKPISRVKRTTVAKAKPISKIKRTTIAKAKPKTTAKTNLPKKTVARSKPKLRIVTRKSTSRKRTTTSTYRRKAA